LLVILLIFLRLAGKASLAHALILISAIGKADSLALIAVARIRMRSLRLCSSNDFTQACTAISAFSSGMLALRPETLFSLLFR